MFKNLNTINRIVKVYESIDVYIFKWLKKIIFILKTLNKKHLYILQQLLINY